VRDRPLHEPPATAVRPRQPAREHLDVGDVQLGQPARAGQPHRVQFRDPVVVRQVQLDQVGHQTGPRVFVQTAPVQAQHPQPGRAVQVPDVGQRVAVQVQRDQRPGQTGRHLLQNVVRQVQRFQTDEHRQRPGLDRAQLVERQEQYLDVRVHGETVVGQLADVVSPHVQSLKNRDVIHEQHAWNVSDFAFNTNHALYASKSVTDF